MVAAPDSPTDDEGNRQGKGDDCFSGVSAHSEAHNRDQEASDDDPDEHRIRACDVRRHASSVSATRRSCTLENGTYERHQLRLLPSASYGSGQP